MQRTCRIELPLARAAAPNGIAVVLASPEMSRLIPIDDFGADPAIVSRFLWREKAHHCPVVLAVARLAKSTFHQCRHEPVRADFSWTTETAMETTTCGRHAKMHSRRRET
jgi:hypothetical protein